MVLYNIRNVQYSWIIIQTNQNKIRIKVNHIIIMKTLVTYRPKVSNVEIVEFTKSLRCLGSASFIL